MNKLNPIPDKIFVAPDGRFVGVADVAREIACKCPYVSDVVLAGKNEREMAAVIFARTGKFEADDMVMRRKGCYCPKNAAGLGRCLSECMDDINESIRGLNTRISSFAIVPHEAETADGRPVSYHHTQETLIRRYEDYLTPGLSAYNPEEVVLVQMRN
jgi:hypothetical protein